MQIPRQIIEAGAMALAHEQGWNWDRFDERSRDGFRYTAEETIRAAIGCAEVVMENDTGKDEVFWGKNGSTHTIRPGDTVLIVRGEP